MALTRPGRAGSGVDVRRRRPGRPCGPARRGRRLEGHQAGATRATGQGNPRSADAVGMLRYRRAHRRRRDGHEHTDRRRAGEALSAVARDGLSGTVDAGDTDAARFGRRVADAVDTDVAVTAEHGADETDSLVGAASSMRRWPATPMSQSWQRSTATSEAAIRATGRPASSCGSTSATTAFCRTARGSRGRRAPTSWPRTQSSLGTFERRELGRKRATVSVLVQHETPEDITVGRARHEHADQHADDGDDGEPGRSPSERTTADSSRRWSSPRPRR